MVSTQSFRWVSRPCSLLSLLISSLTRSLSFNVLGTAMERIANDVLSLARIQLTTLEIFRVEVDLRKESQRICGIFGNEWSVYQSLFDDSTLLICRFPISFL
jgi:hypothetical protein